jgi:BirA family biotin operon repressor/biotin-[acetyl-CoA-carboxylase] ligase
MGQALVDAARLASLLKHDCCLTTLESTTTTNDEVLAFARRSGGAERVKMGGTSVARPFVVVSAEQTAGRGRLGRVWSSPPGGVYLSLLLELKATQVVQSGFAQMAQAALSPLAALAVRGALQEFTADDLRVKWPNDIVSERGKLVGILIELKQESAIFLRSSSPATSSLGVSGAANFSHALSNAQYAVVGIGVNVNRPDSEAIEGAAYLSDGGNGRLSLEDVAAASIEGLLARYETWLAAGCSFASFAAEYHAHMALLGTRICVRNALGDEIASGIVQGIDDDARFILMGEQDSIAVVAGEVTLRDDIAK